MKLQITAELTEQSLTELLADLLPATINLDPLGVDSTRRWIRIEEPNHVDFVPDVGLRVRTSAALQWTAVGLAVPVTLQDVQLLLRPLVVTDERGPKLVLEPSIENADFRFMPNFVDEAISGRINAALAAQGQMIGWHFGESLTHQVPLPANFSPVNTFNLGAGDFTVSVTEHGIVLKLDVTMGFSRLRPDPAI